MDQVKKLLARYVEWITLTLGAAFVLWTVYGYVLSKPISVAVGNRQGVTPSEIDPEIWDGKGKVLDQQVKASAATGVTVPDFATAIKDDITRPTPLVNYSGTPFDTDQKILTADATPDSGDVDEGPRRTQVTALPVPPMLANPVVSAGQSNVTVPPAAGGGMAAGGPGPGIPGVGNAGAAALATATDKAWVTVGATFPAAALAERFKAAKIPEDIAVGSTVVLRLVLVRQELDALGNPVPGSDTEVAPPDLDALLPLPPATAANLDQAGPQRTYETYAEGETVRILRPPFFPVVQGDQWYVPGTTSPNVKSNELVADTFDPKTYTGDGTDLTADQKEALRKYKLEQAAAARAAAAARTPSRPQGGNRTAPGGRRGGGGGGGGGGGASSSSFGVLGGGGGGGGLRSSRGPTAVSGPDDVAPRPDASSPDAASNGPAAAAAAGATPAVELADLPKGRFLPAQQPDFLVWAHDDTVKPGKTYRYKMRYVLYNPVFGTHNLCKDQKLAMTFSLTSEDSDWTAPVSIDSDSNFYADSFRPANGTDAVRFDIFKWRNGAWQQKTIDALPGDAIGTGDPKDAGGFGTGWTLVDVRQIRDEPLNRLLVLASDNGTVEREVRTDARSKKHIDLRKLVAFPNGAPNNGNANPAGLPGGLPGIGAMPGANGRGGRAQGGDRDQDTR